eukprot:CAMPEP_0119472760 /NCGR_PEP_ID=MMETSP1344-20130328/4689_1 /TAXON_ID=236787 /ORGANISM="Florenciella parvula, Strain CCMP2471" /LENGTH=69 /DNA_ID=CAMNT_0007505755 /DNA_START=183 /DNA_END=392 /DNA_ORIENTATION=-
MPLKAVTIFVDEERAPQVVQELAARYQTEVLVPHDAEHPPEQGLCARAKRSLETTAVALVMCDLPIEVS